MYTITTELSHRQTHSTRPAPLCPDQSHLKGFPLPIQGPPLGRVVYLLSDAFFYRGLSGFSPYVGPSVRVTGISLQLVMQSVRQPVTQNPKVHRREVLTAAEAGS